MKLKHLFLAAAAAVLALTGCTKNQPEAGDGFSVNPAAFEVGAVGDSQTLTVTYTGDWQVSSSVSWIKLSATSGKGNGSVDVTIEKNTETTDRNGVIKFTYGNAVKEVPVTQGGGNWFGVTSTYTNPLPNTASEIEFVVEANVAYTVSVDDAGKSWITVNSTKAMKTDNVKVSIAANNGAARTGKITFAPTGVEGMEAETFTIQQSACSDPTKITTAEEFIAMLARPQSPTCDTVYTIMNDIDFTGYAITPENSFNGNFYATLDGQGHKFTNYTATGDMIKILCGTIKNLTVESGTFTLESDHTCGVFFEKSENGSVAENLVNKATITGEITTTDTYHQGAICGICRGTMTGCKNYGNATIKLSQGSKKHYRFGSIAGSAAASDNTYTIAIKNCENHGNIQIECVSAKATTYLAGITGVADAKGCNFSIDGCTNTGKLSITNKEGFSGVAYVGGLIGQRNDGEVKNCTNTGEIDVTALDVDKVYVGGLVAFQKAGYSDTAFEGCKVNANVKASFVNATSTTANPLANAGMIIASVGDAGVTFGSANAKITVSGSLWNGSTEIKVTAGNLGDLVIGSACTYAPLFNFELAN